MGLTPTLSLEVSAQSDPRGSLRPKGWSRGSLRPQEFRSPCDRGGCVQSTQLVYREPPTVRGGSGRQHFTRCGTEPLGDRRSVLAGGCACLPHQPCGLHASHSERPCASYDVAPACRAVSFCAEQGPAHGPGLHIQSGCFSQPFPALWENESRHREKRVRSLGDSVAQW